MSNAIWNGDRLGRRADAEYLTNFLTNRIEERGRSGRTRSYVLNINAPWGSGKTFFLEKLKDQLISERYPVAYVNAWADDHAADPLLSVMSAIDEAITTKIDPEQVEKWQKVKATAGAVAIAITKGAVKHWARKAIGESVDTVSDLVFGENQDADNDHSEFSDRTHREVNKVIDDYSDKLLDGFRKQKDIIKRFQESLTDFIEGVGTGDNQTPLFVLIDELDRCRPLYAIELLERVKHIFETDEVVFIVATDTEQLSHSVKAIYGHDFDAERYLMRFFDRRYEFKVPVIDLYVKDLCARHRLNESNNFALPERVALDTYLAGCFQFFDLSLRDIDQCMDIIRTIETTWTRKDIKIQICLLAPIVCAYQQRKKIDTADDRSQSWKELMSDGQNGEKRPFDPTSSLEFNGYHAARTLSGMSEMSLHEAIQQKVDQFQPSQETPQSLWMRQQFIDEIETLHNGMNLRNKKSIMGLYPDFVKSAGRLVGTAFLDAEK